MERNHKWNKDDTILTFYFVRHELKGLPVKDAKELAEHVIGSSRTSLMLQAANIRYILGYEGGTLTDFSKVQHDVVNEFKDMPVDNLREIVTNIIMKRDFEENIRSVREAKVLKDIEKRKKESKENLDEIFRKMGKDPSKMKKVIK